MSSRPRRTAATKAKETISVHAQWANSSDKETRGGTMSSRRSNRTSGPSIDVRAGSYADDDEPITAASRSRQGARGAANRRGVEAFEGGEIIHGKRDRGGKKSYVVESSPDDNDDEEEEEAQIEVDDEDDEMEDAEEDAEGEDDIDMDAEGDIEMDIPPPSSGPTIKISRSVVPKSAAHLDDNDDDDDDDLSDPGDSDAGDQTLGFADETVGDEDAEGDEIEVAGEVGGEIDSEDDGSDDGEVDMAKLTKRQRARFEDGPQEFMKLSDEVQAKKVFTAEELSMRRQEMARRRRNLSDKRNEEVKMETINKLLKKQAPKVNKKAAAAAAAAEGSIYDEDGVLKASPVFVRWVSNKNGISVAVPREMVNGPAGKLFRGGTSTPPLPARIVEEVA